MDDAQAFEAFVRQHEDMVFSTSRRLVRSEADAADIAQNVFLKAYERFSELRVSANPGGWLRVVARNLSLNHLTRYRQRWSFFSELAPEEGYTPFEETAPGRGETASGQLEAREAQEDLERALQSLPDHQRIPLILFHLEEMSYEAIARQLQISLSKVKTDIHRGRLALRKLLQESA